LEALVGLNPVRGAPMAYLLAAKNEVEAENDEFYRHFEMTKADVKVGLATNDSSE
jgi:hypothetical protein